MKKPAPANGRLVRALCEVGRLLEITADQSSRLQTEAWRRLRWRTKKTGSAPTPAKSMTIDEGSGTDRFVRGNDPVPVAVPPS